MFIECTPDCPSGDKCTNNRFQKSEGFTNQSLQVVKVSDFRFLFTLSVMDEATVCKLPTRFPKVPSLSSIEAKLLAVLHAKIA